MKTLIVTFSILIFITSCNEERKYEKKEYERKSNINDFRSFSLYPKKQTLEVLKKTDTLVLNSGNQLVINLLDFTTEKKIEVTEYTTLSSMILSGLTTLSDGLILRTKGMLNIQTKDSIDNIELLLKDSVEKNEYLIFYGDKNENNINWTPEVHARFEHLDENNNLLRVTYSVSSFFIRKMGWINVDMFLYCKEKKDLIVSVSEKKNVMYYLVLPEYNSMLPAVFDEQGKLTFNDIPVCNSILVGISYEDNIKFKYQEIESNKRLDSFPSLEIVTEEELNNSLTYLEKSW